MPRRPLRLSRCPGRQSGTRSASSGDKRGLPHERHKTVPDSLTVFCGYSVVSTEAPVNTDKYTQACQYRTVPAGTKTSRPITSARTARLIQALVFRFAIATADTIPPSHRTSALMATQQRSSRACVASLPHPLLQLLMQLLLDL